MLRSRHLLFLVIVFACVNAKATDAKPFFTLHNVGPGVCAAIAVPGGHAGSNSGFIIGDKAVLVVDSFEDADAARALLKVIHQKTALPVRYLINTHYHLDHVTGNGVYRQNAAQGRVGTVAGQLRKMAVLHLLRGKKHNADGC